MDREQLQEILEQHSRWLAREEGGKQADLRWADLSWANLRGAALREADLRRANLYRANLYGANLHEANLYGANLHEANLHEAELRGAKYNITQVLMAQWGEVSDELCHYLMKLDASALPNGEERLQIWAEGGCCPLDLIHYDRVAFFHEKRGAWGLDLPSISLYELWERLAAEKGVKID